MKCTVCNNLCEILTHQFYTGMAHYPRINKPVEKEWSYTAPLYHTKNDVGEVIPFCSPKCATEWYQGQKKNVDRRN